MWCKGCDLRIDGDKGWACVDDEDFCPECITKAIRQVFLDKSPSFFSPEQLEQIGRVIESIATSKPVPGPKPKSPPELDLATVLKEADTPDFTRLEVPGPGEQPSSEQAAGFTKQFLSCFPNVDPCEHEWIVASPPEALNMGYCDKCKMYSCPWPG